MVGQRDCAFYDELSRRYPNLLFVDPSAAMNNLVTRAKAVVTFSGTTIIEAFAMQRPVIFTSRSRFGGFGLGSFTQEFLNFAAVLDASRDQVPSDEKLTNMLAALHRQCFRCKFVEPLGNPEVLGTENIDTIATAILGRVYAA